MPPNGSGGISVIGRRSHQRVGLRVVGKFRATSTASADGVVGLPSRKVARSGLLVRAPYRAACRLIDCPPTEGTVSLIKAPPAPGWRTRGVKGAAARHRGRPGRAGAAESTAPFRDDEGRAWAARGNGRAATGGEAGGDAASRPVSGALGRGLVPGR